ncbi:MAG: class I SAM-dependent methyltransferase [Verrucomicrobiota bacterium]
MKSSAFYIGANRLAWDEAMPRHQAKNQSKWDDRFQNPDYYVFENPELEKLNELGISGKDIAHVCCNNGVELMSLKNLGANRCVGFDFSEMAISEAQRRAKACGISCEFFRTDVYEIEDRFYGIFDIVYVSIGCFGWLPDLEKLFKKISSLLKKGGVLFVYEQHPFVEMLPTDSGSESDPLKIVEPYFRTEPFEDTHGIDYVGGTVYDSKPNYWFVWTLSDIFMSLKSASLQLDTFYEYPQDISAEHQRTENAGVQIPLSYILTARSVVYTPQTPIFSVPSNPPKWW